MYSFNLTPTIRNLILLNVAIFFVQAGFPVGALITRWGSLYPFDSAYFGVWQFVTYMFLHGSWGHLLSNMFGLFIFGPLLEQSWGGQRLLVFYLLCGVGAGFLYQGVRTYEQHRTEVAYQEFRAQPQAYEYDHFMKLSGLREAGDEEAANALNRNPRNEELRQVLVERAAAAHRALHEKPIGGMLGASGALFGIMLALAYLFPNTTIYQIPIPFPIKVKYFVLYYLVLEVYAGIHQAPGDNVAHFAHLGGALVGFLILRYWERGRARFY